MSESVTKPSRSQAPGPMPSRQSSRQVTRAARRRVSSQSALCAQVIARCEHPVSDDLRAFYHSALSDHAAARVGLRRGTRAIVGAWITAATTYLPWVLSGRVAGYGAVRMRYAAELAQELATPGADAPPAGTPATPVVTAETAAPAELATLKRTVAQALSNLGFGVKVGLSSRAGASDVAHTLEQLAEAVQRAQVAVPADGMTDAGLTTAVIDTLNAAALTTLSAHTSATASRAHARSATQRERCLAGRLARETRLLLASARTSCKGDVEIPKAPVRHRARAKTPATVQTPAQPATSATDVHTP